MNICIHYIIACRQRHPKTIIWLAIQDYKSAYCRTHLHPEVSVKSMTPFPNPTLDMVIMVLRMTFGGKPNASEWGYISETVADLANKLLVCDSWDPSTLYSLLQNKIPPRKTLDSNIPFAPAYSTSVNIPTEDKGKVDVYIDDNIAIGPDLPGVPEKLEAAIPLAIHAITRLLDENELILRHNIISLSKLLTNG